MSFPTRAATKVATMLLRMLAIIPMVPAMILNVDWGGPSPWLMNLVGVLSIVLTAVFVEAGVRSRSWLMMPILISIGTAGSLINVQNALTNLGRATDHESDQRRSQMKASSLVAEDGRKMVAARAEVAKLAGEQPPDVIEADIQRTIAADANRYRATSECDVQHITAGPSMTWCASINDMKAKKAAAIRRDDLDAQIKVLNAKSATMTTVSSDDPFADRVVMVMKIVGVHMSAEQRDALSSQKDVGKAVFYEIAATFGPTAWFIILGTAGAAGHMPGRLRSMLRRREQQPKGKAKEPDDFDKFVAEIFEIATGAYITSLDAWNAWQSWCHKKRQPPGNRRDFGMRFVRHFSRDDNHGRPRYCNVQFRASLRLVASNG